MHANTQDLELWGGIESTVNRVGDRYFDQDTWSGHRARVEQDLQQIAGLGIRTLRIALLWEVFQQTGNWQSFDRSVAAMQQLYLQPIVGLVHHGSGPPTTSLLDPAFPQKLAAYALQVAQRYPWITDYTPVNEPHTTARFSCLYGHWFPHLYSISSYLRALLNEVKATVLSMQAIRTVQPEARLIYTEDGGSIFSTPPLESFRAERELRRWLGTDLLCGLVTTDHPLFQFLIGHGFTAQEVLWFQQNPCPPAILGLNYYLTSDRFLDHRVHLYPPHLRGGDSGSEPLVDIEALRVRPEGLPGVGPLLLDAWNRYNIPVAITEVHLGDHHDDQIRWLAEVWNAARTARNTGADVRAVTAWAVLGSWNWCNLCTRDAGIYEPGLFDIRGGKPVPTPLAAFARQLANAQAPRHPVLHEPGWWTRAERITYANANTSD